MSGLKNFTRVQTSISGHTTWALLDEQGTPVSAFSYFCEKNWDYAFATQKRYAEVVAGFLDYLFEAKAFGAFSAPSRRYLNEVIDAYPVILRDGTRVVRERLATSLHKHSDNKWLYDVCSVLKREPLAANRGIFRLLASNLVFLSIKDSKKPILRKAIEIELWQKVLSLWPGQEWFRVSRGCCGAD